MLNKSLTLNYESCIIGYGHHSDVSFILPFGIGFPLFDPIPSILPTTLASLKMSATIFVSLSGFPF